MNLHPSRWLAALLALCLQACTCGGGNVAIAIAPPEVTVETGKTVAFSASVSGASDSTVTWSVQEADGGSITGGGVYTAPLNAGTFHVIAANGSARATATVTVVAATSFVVSPATVSVQGGRTQQFTAALDGTTIAGVTWSVQEGAGGAIDATGLYTAPITTGTYHVVATLLADPSKTATAAVTITPASLATVTLTPPAASVLGGATVTFNATVTGVSNTAVTFGLVELNGGTVNATGPNSAIYTAPFTPGTYHLIATSAADPTAVGSATITVAFQPIAVSVSPPQVSVSPNGTQQFTAQVQGTTNTAVTWSVTGGGSISNTGLYTAPASPGATVTVTATSVADNTATGTATVNILNPGGNQVTGTVAYAGAKTGRIYLSVEDANGAALAGTSLAAPGSFTIRGIQTNGAVTVRAWRDALGSATFNRAIDPLGTAGLTLPQSVTPLLITLTDPAATTPPKPVDPPYVVGTAGAATIFFTPLTNAVTGEERVDHYRFYWSTTANPGPSNMTGSKEVKAGGNGFAVLFDASLTGNLFFSVSSVIQGVESATTPTATATAMSAAPQGSTLSGTVTGFASTDPLVVLALGVFNGAYSVVATRIPNPTASQAYSLTKVPRGDYTLYAWIDSGNNNDWDVTDVGNFSNAPQKVTVQGTPNATVTQNTALSVGSAVVKPVSEHTRYFGSESFRVGHNVLSNQKQVVAVSVDSGPNLAGPLDAPMVGGGAHSGSVTTPAAPTTGSNYSYTLTFADGTTATATAPVTAVLTGLPTLTSPTATAGTTPTFTWSAPNPAPASAYTYALYLYDQNSQFSGYAADLPSTTTQLAYSGLGYAPTALTAGTYYYWYLLVTDADGNTAGAAAYFVAQ